MVCITDKDKFAFLPKRCSKCNTLFWLETYNIYYEKLGLQYDLKSIKCKRCIDKSRASWHGIVREEL